MTSRQRKETVGDAKLVPGYGRSIRGLRLRGLVDVFEADHVYLTDAGRAARLA